MTTTKRKTNRKGRFPHIWIKGRIERLVLETMAAYEVSRLDALLLINEASVVTLYDAGKVAGAIETEKALDTTESTPK